MLIGMSGSMWMGSIVMAPTPPFMSRLRGMTGRTFAPEEKPSRPW
ncbi:Uncharacterised protein [Mycobacterium tuberculosis]|uniref:Uncharacterized protein n=1 Tax=Mycobacterium tuberculosis TaxID=1773 RepID=A0A0T9F1G8_MYCTX|nr:Uncharacterised protein [Mycobacterium tuberculosis]CFR66538.1 Uncharacterised protein [Mycobacterium tuberculosis]CFS29213.1 Uncharacterised protein [Mycobacterium tuberculosis]CKT59432.1 Uncharacterised protein [Mycobacterium tuberculosis]CNM90773.1 Uncharacterised protein [Mycobacterium tuberculosis]